jgi:hypothetical protein
MAFEAPDKRVWKMDELLCCRHFGQGGYPVHATFDQFNPGSGSVGIGKSGTPAMSVCEKSSP